MDELGLPEIKFELPCQDCSCHTVLAAVASVGERSNPFSYAVVSVAASGKTSVILPAWRPARINGWNKAGGLWRAIACNGLRQGWQSWQRWQFRICILRRGKGSSGFESHPLRHFSKSLIFLPLNFKVSALVADVRGCERKRRTYGM
jgi:hypothetical protein